MPANSASVKTATVSGRESEAVARANTSGLTPVVFVHGLWLLPTSWDRWRTVFEDQEAVVFARN